MNDPTNRDVAVFTEALQLPASERPAYLDAACGNDGELRRKVEALINSHDRIGNFLEESPPGISQPVKRVSSVGEKPGDRIGHFKLLQQIGEGGCGVVFMAEQEEPVRRRVALKVIKPGMDTKNVIIRFEAERQVLALMDHPNVAKIFDAGTTESGRPYFVMELIRGVKITEYCDQRALSTGERLKLFVQVCKAIQHAHHRGIIHRDIKPSNILVATTTEGAALPVVIDFGIAKATVNQQLTDKTLFTAFEMLIGTPAYMSPEQAEVTSVDVDTRTDIYSLGVLLYELLTGSTPFDATALLQAGLDKIRRVIREEEPATPSNRLSKMTVAELTTIAQLRKSEPPALIRIIRGDLDWIAMKALEKDRARRYDSANEFAMDVQRYLENEPVVARPPSTIYRLQKLVHRHKFAFGAGAALAVMLVLGLTASLWQAARARREAEMAAAVSEFITDLLKGPGFFGDGRTVTVAELLDKAAPKLELRLANQPENLAVLRTTLARTYDELSLPHQAIRLRENARDYYLKTFGPEYPATLTQTAFLATSYFDVGRKDEALRMREQLLMLRRKLNRPDDKPTLVAMSDLALSYFDAGRTDEAFKLWDEVLTLLKNAKGGFEEFDLLTSMNNEAFSLFQKGRIDESLKMQETVMMLTRTNEGPERPNTLTTMNNLALSYAAAGRTNEALKLEEEVLTLRRKVNGPEATPTLIAMNNLANLYNDLGRKDEALELFEELFQVQRKTLDPEHPDTMCRLVIYHLESLYFAAGRKDEALKLREELVNLERTAFDPEHPSVIYLPALYSLADSCRIVGRNDEALKLREEAVTVLRRIVDANPDDTDKAKQLATVYLWMGRTNEHQAICRRLLNFAANTNDPASHDRAAKAYLIQSHPDPELLKLAVASGRRVLQLASTNDPNRPWFTVTAAMAALRDGKLAEAESLSSEAFNFPDGNRIRRSLALAYRALARAHMGRNEEARADVAELEKLIPKFPAPLALSAISLPSDSLAICLAREEAKALLSPISPSKP